MSDNTTTPDPTPTNLAVKKTRGKYQKSRFFIPKRPKNRPLGDVRRLSDKYLFEVLNPDHPGIHPASGRDLTDHIDEIRTELHRRMNKRVEDQMNNLTIRSHRAYDRERHGKTCTKCDVTYPFEEAGQQFHRRGGKLKHLLMSHCKACHRAMVKANTEHRQVMKAINLGDIPF